MVLKAFRGSKNNLLIQVLAWQGDYGIVKLDTGLHIHCRRSEKTLKKGLSETSLFTLLHHCHYTCCFSILSKTNFISMSH